MITSDKLLYFTDRIVLVVETTRNSSATIAQVLRTLVQSTITATTAASVQNHHASLPQQESLLKMENLWQCLSSKWETKCKQVFGPNNMTIEITQNLNKQYNMTGSELSPIFMLYLWLWHLNLVWLVLIGCALNDRTMFKVLAEAKH